MANRDSDFQFCRSEGGLLPPDLLRRVVSQDKDLAITSKSYALPEGERLNDTIAEAWSRLRKYWLGFEDAAKGLGAEETGTGLTNDKWSLPLLKELGYGPLPASAALKSDDDSTAITRAAGPVPIHLVGCGLSLDKRVSGQKGAAKASPHGVLQDFLNRSDGHLWGIVSNGRQLRVLRDSQKLSRQAYVEFDLEGMFRNEGYSDFVLLYLLVHATRFIPADVSKPDACIAETWAKASEAAGTRALESLRAGVENALEKLGKGLYMHPANRVLRDDLREGRLSLTDFHTQLLRVVYRIIFLCVAEDRTLEGRSLLHPHDDSDVSRQARERYAKHYSLGHLRRLAGAIKGSRHSDLWQQFQVVIRALSGDPETAAIRDALALPALGSFLWASDSTPALNGLQMMNVDLLDAVRELAFTRQDRALRPVDYRNLGTEELGSVYEGLLALTPQLSDNGERFYYQEFAGNLRKTSGSYYTPDSLVQCLLDSALDPVVAKAIEGKVGAEAESAILELKVCDPAVGSGHFLVGAAHRLARHLARVRAHAQGESEPSPLLYQRALRDVIGRCLYGVDLNPMSAELCRVSLWLEALEPGKPLSFLDHHVQVGNSLVGATPELLENGIPDEAFDPLEGDDRKWASEIKKRNKKERALTRIDLFAPGNQAPEAHQDFIIGHAALDDMDDSTPGAIEAKRTRYDQLRASADYRWQKLVADTWCAAFFWSLRRNALLPVTTEFFRQMREDAAQGPSGDVLAEIRRIAAENRFLHWHLAFPEVFAKGGFDCVLGNPPWERLKLQEIEYFSSRDPVIAEAKNAAARKALIDQLPAKNPGLAAQWAAAVRRSEAEMSFMRLSGRFPLGGVGDVNTYAVFADHFKQLMAASGAAAVIIPSGLVTGFSYQRFLQRLLSENGLASCYGFENEDLLFPQVTNKTKFILLTMYGENRPVKRPWFTAHLRQPEQVHDPARRYSLTAEEIEAINPNTLTVPMFRWARDARVAAKIHSVAPVLVRRQEDGKADSPWGARMRRLFDMANDSALFLDHADIAPLIAGRDGAAANLSDGRVVYPLYEGKMLWHFDHRYGTYEGQTQQQANKGVLPHVNDVLHDDPSYRIQSRYWVSEAEALAALGEDRARKWFFAFRDVGPSERTFVGAVIPRAAAGSQAPFLVLEGSASEQLAALALLCSVVVDYSARQKSSRMAFFVVEQFPMLIRELLGSPRAWLGCSPVDWLAPRALELTCTSDELAPFAEEVGYCGPAFRWSAMRRSQLQAEIDALALHLYGLSREDAEWILASFTVLEKYEQREHGEYLTKRLILERYDAMQQAQVSGQSYISNVSPPPGPPTGPNGEFLPLPPWPKGAPRPKDWPEHIHPPISHRQ